MIDINEWRRVPLDERLSLLAQQAEDPLLREAITETLRLFSNIAVHKLQARIIELECEVGRLERLAYAPTPY